MKYYRKVDPNIRVVISTGESVKFEAVSWDTGVYPHEGKGISDWLINELQTAIAQGRGGMTEITFEEYSALLAKKKAEPDGLSRPWREEFKMDLSLEKHLAQQAEQKRQSTPAIVPPVPPVAAAGAEINMEGQARKAVPPAPPVVQGAGGPATGATPTNAPALPRPTASKPKPPPKK